jgi:hypothetical protein
MHLVCSVSNENHIQEMPTDSATSDTPATHIAYQTTKGNQEKYKPQ